MKKLDTGQSDILVLADVPPPPPEIEIGLNMDAIGTKIILREVIKYILSIYPPQPFYYHYLILCLNRKLVNFNFRWIFELETHPPPLSSQKNKMLIFGLRSTSGDWLGLGNGLEPRLPPISSQKNEMLIFGLCSTSDDRLGWSMDPNPICHPSPAKKIKCSFLDYVQLLMIG